jgi:cyclopropane-fatty-acyl-phospholipid synthase
MAIPSLESAIQNVLIPTGITINGPNPWDIQVKNPRLYSRVLRGGSLAFGESYMDGWWEAEALDETIARMVGAHLE